MFPQHRSKRCDVARDDRSYGRLEPGHWAVARHSLGKCRQLSPILKTIFIGDDRLRVRKLEFGGFHFGYRLAAKVRMQPFEPPPGGVIARLQSVEQRLCLLLVLLKPGLEWKGV